MTSRIWWREGKKGVVIKDMQGLIKPFAELMGGWKEILDVEFGIDIDNIDCALEQFWAIKVGLADECEGTEG